jgi:hypothetical protein
MVWRLTRRGVIRQFLLWFGGMAYGNAIEAANHTLSCASRRFVPPKSGLGCSLTIVHEEQYLQ